jgi:hypothetical protein
MTQVIEIIFVVNLNMVILDMIQMEVDLGPSGLGGKPKGKRAERQKKTGVSAESFNAYSEVVSEQLLDEGFA